MVEPTVPCCSVGQLGRVFVGIAESCFRLPEERVAAVVEVLDAITRMVAEEAGIADVLSEAGR